jgi:orotate phosphoribosyltransferase
MSNVLAEKRQLHALLLKHSVRFGEFTLVSGQKSTFYFDGKPVGLTGMGHKLIGTLFFDAMTSLERVSPFDACGGVALGGVPLASALCMTAAFAGRELPMIIVRKEKKDHGTEGLVESGAGLSAGARVVLVEDVITTGGSAIRAAQALRAAGYVIDQVLCILDRSQGKHELGAHGMSLTTLFTLNDFVNASEQPQTTSAKEGASCAK